MQLKSVMIITHGDSMEVGTALLTARSDCTAAKEVETDGAAGNEVEG